MPIASRSDCTQVDVTERYRFEMTSDGWTGEIEQTDLDFNACQAAGGNNDLEDYYQRLVDEGKVTAEQQTDFKKYIVGDNNCDDVFPTLWITRASLMVHRLKALSTSTPVGGRT